MPAAVDWTALPLAVACQVVADVVAGFRDAGSVARLLAPLQSTCRWWHHAVSRTLLDLCVCDGSHVRAEVMLWLSNLSLKVLTFPKALAAKLGEQEAFLKLDTAAKPSASTLQRLAGLPSAQLLAALHHLPCLATLDLHMPPPRILQLRKGTLLQPAPTYVDLSLLANLRALRALSVTGHFQLAGIHRLPPAITRLRLSSYDGQLALGASPTHSLPATLHLQHLHLKARVVFLTNWRQLCRQAHRVHVSASRLVVGIPRCGVEEEEEVGGSSERLFDVGGQDLALYQAFAEEVAAADDLSQVVLHVQRMQLYSSSAAICSSSCTSSPLAAGGGGSELRSSSLAGGSTGMQQQHADSAEASSTASAAEGGWGLTGQLSGLEGGHHSGRLGPVRHAPMVATKVDGYDMVGALRDELVGSHSVSSCYVSCNFSSDEMAHDAVASVFRIERQPRGAAKSFCFLTPTTPKEHAMLQTTPVAELQWCRDAHAMPLLRSPGLIAHSAATLRMLGPILLSPGLDLSPFTHLSELHGLLDPPAHLGAPLQPASAALALGTATHSPIPLAAISLPPSLALLGIQACEGPAPHFDASATAGLASLRELRLGGFATHDLRALPPAVTSLTITNPCLASPCPVLGGGCILLPQGGAQSPTSGRRPGAGGRMLMRVGSCFSARRSASTGAAAASGGSCSSRRGSFCQRAHGPFPPHVCDPQEEEEDWSVGTPAGTARPGGVGAPAPVPTLHLHLIASLAAELAVDLSWALSQPALRQLTISGSHVRQGQALRLHLSCRGMGWEGAAGRELAQQLARSQGLCSLVVHPHLSTVTLQPSSPKLLQRLGIPPSQLQLGRVLAAAARLQPCSGAGGRGRLRRSTSCGGGGGGGCGVLSSSSSLSSGAGEEVAPSGTATVGGCSRSGRPWGEEGGEWRVESWLGGAAPVACDAGTEAAVLEWAEGVREDAWGLRVVWAQQSRV